MAADQWQITAADRDSVTVIVTVNDVPHPIDIAYSQLTPFVDQATALGKIRTIVVGVRNAILAKGVAPAVAQSAIGYSEPF